MLRAYLLGYMLCFTFAGGGLALLMLQYVSGGKWGLLLRRPLEAMTRTLPLVGNRSQARTRKVVVFPAPFSPSRPITSPCAMLVESGPIARRSP